MSVVAPLALPQQTSADVRSVPFSTEWLSTTVWTHKLSCARKDPHALSIVQVNKATKIAMEARAWVGSGHRIYNWKREMDTYYQSVIRALGVLTCH
jgi:hypothetical protein